MESPQQKKKAFSKSSVPERRQGPDIVVRLINGLSIAAWILFVIAALLLDLAKPRIETFFDRLFHVVLSKNWDTNLLKINFYVMAAMLGISVSGLLLNQTRMRRATDRYRRSLLLMAFLSVSGVILYFWR